MFIVLQHKIVERSTDILRIFASEVDAIEFLHKRSRSHHASTARGTGCEVQIVGENRVEIVQRVAGWLSTSKNCIHVYEVKEYQAAISGSAVQREDNVASAEQNESQEDPDEEPQGPPSER